MNQEELQDKCWHACYKTGDLEFVKACVKNGLDVNAKASVSGAVPLDAAIYGGHHHIFEYLLLIGADVNAIGYGGGTILMAAANQADVDRVKLLLEKGADPNLPSPITGETPLHAVTAKAFNEGAFECVELLLKGGANPNAKAKSGIETSTYYRDIRVVGETPLHLAAAYGSSKMMQLLLAYKADPSLLDDRGDSALTWYSRHQRTTQHITLDRDSRNLLLYGKWK